MAQCQRDLFKTVKADKVLGTYPVFNMSEGGAEPTNVGLQYLTIPEGAHTDMPDGTQYADYANVHNYVSSKKVLYDDNQAWQAADPTLDGDWDGLYGEYGRTWRGKFSGYSDAQLKALTARHNRDRLGYRRQSRRAGRARKSIGEYVSCAIQTRLALYLYLRAR